MIKMSVFAIYVASSQKCSMKLFTCGFRRGFPTYVTVRPNATKAITPDTPR